jgi:hypothetical protein
MKLIKILVIVFLFLILLMNTVIKELKLYSPTIEESFLSGTSGIGSYQECIDKGYTKEFCLQTPSSVFGPSSCLCNNGSMGYLLPGFRGHCVCNNGQDV